MIDLNRPIQYTADGDYIIRVPYDEKLEKLVVKYRGTVNVKISKPTEPGTEQQNKAMHSLLFEYYASGYHSAPDQCTPEFFKNWMKAKYGVGWDYDLNGEHYKILKSWSAYTKDERMEFLSKLISEVRQSGAYAEIDRIREIVDGIESEK